MRTSGSEVEVVLDDVRQWYAFSWSHGQHAMWEAVPEAGRDTVRDVAGELLEQAREPDGRIHLRQQIRCTLAALPS